VQELASLLPFVGIALLFWLLIIRPQSKRQKAVASMQAGLEVGTDVMLTSGVYGTVERVEDDVVHVRVADGVTLKVAKGAVGSVVHPEPVDEPVQESAEEPAAEDGTPPTSRDA
jgi:preprotein translocase subunit YajC